MNCPKCGFKMVIDSWNGWFWTCFNCGHVGRQATHEEADNNEKEMEEYFNKSRKVFER